jgi:hypothetical protein
MFDFSFTFTAQLLLFESIFADNIEKITRLCSFENNKN